VTRRTCWGAVGAVALFATCLALALVPTVSAEILPPIVPGSHEPRPAVVRQGVWYLRDTTTSGVADHTFQYGDPGDVPMFGDWDGNGTATPAVFRNGVWYLRESDTTGVADITFVFGQPADTPIVGDWNGDGVETPGVVRDGVWYLRNSNTTGVADITFVYGVPGDRVIAGDWDGNGTATPGVARAGDDGGVPNGSGTTCGGCPFRWLERNENSTGLADAEFDCGNDKPVPGAWGHAARDECGWVIGNEWKVYAPGGGFTTFTFGDPGDTALAWRLPPT